MLIRDGRYSQVCGWTARAVRQVGVCAFLIAIAVFRLEAQTTTFSGYVRDGMNGTIPEAKIVLASQTAQSRYDLVSDDNGQFSTSAIPPGDYVVDVQRPGFQPRRDVVTLVGTVRRDIVLEIGALTEALTVTPGHGVGAPQTAQTSASTDRSQPCVLSAQGGQIQPPRKVRHVNPAYPVNPDSSLAGVVVVRATIGIDGRVHDPQVMKSPHPELTQSALAAFEQWEFTPTLLNCAPVEVSITATMNFASR